MKAELRIRLLGGFRAELESGPVAAEDWRRNKAKAVVKLLSLAPAHQLHREELAEALWPELAPEAAHSNLRKAVHFARRALGPSRLKAEGDLISLEDTELWIDVDAFVAAAQAGEAQRAIDLYAGELLPEDRFEPWAETHRERLRARFAQVLSQRAAELEDSADLRGAAAMLERLVQEDPYNEQAHLALMRIFSLEGRRHRAVHLFQQLEKRLGEDLGVDPKPEARQLLDEILAGRISSRPASLSPAELGLPAGSAEERKLITMLVAGISPGTSHSPASEGARRSVRAGISILIELLGKSKALVQTSGESVVSATFGVPRVREGDQEHALLAGLEIVQRVSALNHRLGRRGLPAVEVRVAINSGQVQVNRLREGYEVTGEAMAATIDLHRQGPAGTVIVGGRVRRSASWRFKFGETLRSSVTGARQLPARRLISVTPAFAQRGQDEPPLVGRDAELEVLSGLFGEVVGTGAPRFVLISGAPGIGKSRLLREATRALGARHPLAREIHGRCLEIGQGITHSALAEILREACAISLDDSLPMVLAKLRDGLAETLEPLQLSAPDLATTIAALASTAAVTLPGSPLRGAEPGVIAEEQTRAWTRFASALGDTGPTLILIEDLHWAAERLLAILERMMVRSSGPLLVLATARPEFLERRADFGAGNERFSSISLRALTGNQGETLMNSLRPARGLTMRRRRSLLGRAEGNPYFLQELVRHLEERGADKPAETPDPEPDLPDSLQILLAARIDSLPPPAKRALQEASVMGRVFWSGPLAASLGETDISGELGELERRGFILGRPRSALAGQEEFIFNHALLREVAYASLPTRRRIRAHAALGAWLEVLAAQRQEEVAELLAFHFAAATAGEGDLDAATRERIRTKAFEYLVLAGTLARKRDAAEKAIDLHTSALRLAAAPRERLRALEELGDDHDSAFHGDAALACYEQAIELARSDSAGKSRLCWKAARSMAMSPGAYGINPDPFRVERFVVEGLALAPDDLARARLLVVRGAVARLFRGSEPFGQGARPDPMSIEDRIGAVTEAMELTQIDQPELLASARSTLGILYGVAGRYGDMVQLAQAELKEMDVTISSLEQADIVRRVAVNTINISGAFEEGLLLASRCHELSKDGNPHQIMHATWPALVALYQLGRWQEMLSILDEHLAAFRADPALQCHFVRDGPMLGAVLMMQVGASERAIELAALVGDPLRDPEGVSAWQAHYAVLSGDPEMARALSLPKVLEGRTYGPQHCVPLLEALIALGDWKGLREHLPRARAATAGNAILAPFADRAEGLRDMAAGAVDTAIKALRRARRGFDRLGVRFESARVAEQLAVIEPVESRSGLLESAADVYSKLGAAGHLERARAGLAAIATRR